MVSSFGGDHKLNIDGEKVTEKILVKIRNKYYD
jgi:hypothetical protein